MGHRSPDAAPTSQEAVLTKAFLRAGSILGLSQRELAAIVGMSPASLSRLSAGSRSLRPETKEGELALLLLRVFRSLDSLVGGAATSARSWLRAYNHHLAGEPLELMKSVRGLVDVAQYLDGIRGKA